MAVQSYTLKEVESSEATCDLVIAGGVVTAGLWWCSTRGSADCAAHYCTDGGGAASGHAGAGTHGYSSA